jgi:acetyltransferase-like isoleucine patch superfamily enzyme
MVDGALQRAVHALHGWVEEAGAIRSGTPRAADFGSFGAESYLAHPVTTLYGERSIHIGSQTLIGRGCSLLVGYSAEDPALPARGLVIGDRCVIGAGAVLTAHTSIVLEDDVWLGQNVFVSDASHGYQDPATPIGRQLGEHQPVRIGAGSWIGHGAMVLPGTTIGRQVVVGAGSVVRGQVPDHAVVAGVPAKVVRRLEAGVGWAAASDPTDVRPIWTTAEIARLMGEPEPS